MILFSAFCCLGFSHAAEWEAGDGFRSRSLAVPAGGKAGFTLLDSALTGIHFTNVLSMPRQLRSHVLLNGSGVAAGDVDGDGWCDLYFCGLDGPNVLYRNLGDWKFQDVTAEAGVACAELDATGAAFADLDGDGDLDLIVNSTGGGTYVFSNNGKGRFQMIARLNPGKGGTSMALADIDGDGYLDVYVANYRITMLVDMPQTNFRFTQANGKKVLATVNGRPVSHPEFADRFIVNATGGIDEQGEMDVLYRNRGGTNFSFVPLMGGAFLDEEGRPLVEKPLDWGLAAMFRDINGDSLPDLYVCNDFDSPDRLWINVGSTNAARKDAPLFRAVQPLALRKLSLFSMGVDFADINRDGHDDFFVLDMLSRSHVRRLTQMPDRKPPVPVIGQFQNRPQYTMNTLFLNQGDGTYTEMAQLAGVAASEWSWTPVFLDVDLDGWEDLLIANGHARDARNLDVLDRLQALRTQKQMSNDEILEARKIFTSLAVAKVAFRNKGDLTFEEIGKQWGFDTVSVSHGMATADLDNDGDLDVVMNNLNGPAGIYRNNSSANRVAVRLKGQKPNTAGIGSKIKVTGGPVPQSQEMICGGRYLSSDQPMRTFAAGSSTNLSIEVIWRSGKHSVVAARPNRVYEIEELEGRSGKGVEDEDEGRARRGTAPLFQDVSRLINHSHHDDPFNDYERQPLLPKKLSQLGPGICWGDLDGDGWDDLIISGGKGGQMAIYRNDGRGGFKRMESPLLTQPNKRDQTTILTLPPRTASGSNSLLVGSSNYEDGSLEGGCVHRYDLTSGKVEDVIPGQQSSSGALALADLDNDSDLDLFVGGRVIPGKYPQAASSLVLRNSEGKFELDRETTKALAEVGLVTGAVFSDIDGNGAPELIVTCEWGPIKIFRNEAGRLSPWDAPVLHARPSSSSSNQQQSTLSQLTGWWNGVTTGDFDGDGRLDIIAGNWGRNTPYQAHREDPLRARPSSSFSSSTPLTLIYGDLDANGSEDMLEGYHDPELKMLVSMRMASFVGVWLPFVGERFNTYEAFARASLQQICGPQWKNARQLQANWLESTLFLNRGDGFEARPLPVEAQMSPAFAVCAADFDGDGQQDAFLSQNFFAAQPDTPRYDGGRGLLLRGNGSGGFTAVPGQESGIKVYGEQRGAAISDWDGDGRIDLAVSQNGAETKLFRNASAKPGLRVRLVGPPENPDAIGAVLRLIGANTSPSPNLSGPAQEIHAGSGYWSQDSAVQVLSRPSSSDQLWIRWPGGKVSTAKIPDGAREMSIGAAGKISIVK